MYPESDFYQISGHKAHSHLWFEKYNDKPLIQAIASMEDKLFRPGGKDSPIELVLGILPSGASYLLMTSEQMLTFTHKYRQQLPRNPWRASEFLSLSPIYFHTAGELADKIATYKHMRKKSRREPGETQDNSKANRGYVLTGTNFVHYRGYFEQQRALYRLITRDLEPGKVGLAPLPWLGGVRVVSLVFGEWSTDDRPRAIRLNDPWLVDVGWTDAKLPAFFERLGGESVHFNLTSSMKKNREARDACFSEVVETNHTELYRRLQHLLHHDADQKGTPLIVLVYDEEMARSVLSRAGIDLDGWSSGLTDLLRVRPAKNRVKVEEDTPDPVMPAPSVVDVQKLVKAVMETNPGHTIPHSAKVLRMQTDTRTCAGDDSLLLLRMWTSMAQGLAIDEQHKERVARQPERALVLEPPAKGNAVVVDPNDMPPPPKPAISDDFSDDDDW